MHTIIVLFNLQPTASITDYEAWARANDLPTVQSLPSVHNFSILKTTGILGTSNPAPYQYCELIQVPNMEAFFADLSLAHVKAGAKAFNEFALNPIFITANTLQ